MKPFKYLDRFLTKAFEADNVKHARVLLILFIIVLLLPIILTKIPGFLVDFSETGQIGDTIGGITAPFIGLIAGYLTFLAFHEQYKSNSEAHRDIKREQFESKYYNCLSLLNNLELHTEIPNIGNYKKAYYFMYYEYKAVLWLLKYKTPDIIIGRGNDQSEIVPYFLASDNHDSPIAEWSKLYKQAYSCFMNGVSKSKTIANKENSNALLSSDNDYLYYIREYINNGKYIDIPYLSDFELNKLSLFEGHRYHVDSFFRFSLKILEMIENEGGDNKIIYISTFMSILTEHQIALLKIIYLYDDRHKSYISSNDAFFNSFFTKGIDDYLPWYMNCTNPKFVGDYPNFEFPKELTELV